MSKRKGTHRERLLALLSDGKWHSNTSLARVAGFRYGAIVHNLRREGYPIESEMVGKDVAHWRYRLP